MTFLRDNKCCFFFKVIKTSPLLVSTKQLQAVRRYGVVAITITSTKKDTHTIQLNVLPCLLLFTYLNSHNSIKAEFKNEGHTRRWEQRPQIVQFHRHFFSLLDAYHPSKKGEGRTKKTNSLKLDFIQFIFVSD